LAASSCDARASPLFFNDVLQDLTIERQIRDEPLEAAILFAQLA
jgi:hypothetical protein